MLSFDDARARVLAEARRVGAERVAVSHAAGRVLAEDVTAPFDLPPFDHSMMDGYALSVAGLTGSGPHRLAVHGEARAGGPAVTLAPGAACRIFTGAMLPVGADAVVMQEHVTRNGDAVVLDKAPRAGAHVRRKGDDLAAGAAALQRGTRLRAAHVALAATVDRPWLDVARRPVVTLVATGDELRSPGAGGPAGSVVECNALCLSAVVARAGGVPRVAPMVGDDPKALAQALGEALTATDVLVTIGGASVGDHDLARPSLVSLGVVLDFYKVAMKPGKPLMVGRRGEVTVLGLPGNPAAAMITFAMFGVPLLRAMQGDAHPVDAPVPARLGAPFSREPGRTEVVRAHLSADGGALVATPLANQASNAVPPLAAADALIVVGAEVGHLEAGAAVSVVLLRDVGL